MTSIKFILKSKIPKKVYSLLRNFVNNLKALRFIGLRFICSICGWHFRKMMPFGIKSRPNAECPKCKSLERHRLLWLFLREKTNFFKDKLKVLDIAPMEDLQNKFKKLPNINYLSVDICSPLATIKADITDMKIFNNNEFDYIFCYHVLDDVSNDRKAMKELYRILKSGGCAILQSPINFAYDKTVELVNTNLSIEEKKIICGDKYSRRIYGKDYANRLQEAGFMVKKIDFNKELGDNTIKKHRLDKNEIIYYCIK